MDAGGTRVLESPRQFLQESPSQSGGGAVSTFGKTCSNFQLDNARTVALETTENPLSYWPPPSSSLPLMSSSREMVDNFQSQPCSLDHSYPMDSLKHLDSSAFREQPAKIKDSDDNHSLNEGLSSISANKLTNNLHHHLPPIAGITSSHNYRGAKETHKYSQINTVEAITRSVTEKISTEKSSVECSESNKNGSSTNSVNSNISSNSGKSDFRNNNNNCEVEGEEPVKTKTNSEVLNGEKVNHSEIEKVKLAPPEEDLKNKKSDYTFSVPIALNSSTSHPKALLSPRAPTPFVHSSAPSPSSNSSFSEVLTLNTNITSNLSTGSLSPPNKNVPSPQFISPSPKSSHVQCGSPSESPRILPSPHSNLSSPSNLHRTPAPSPHSIGFSQNNSPSHRPGSLPYVQNSNSNIGYLNISKTNINNSLAQNFYSDSCNPNSAPDTVETVRMVKESNPQNSTNHKVEIDLSNLNIPLRNQSHSNASQRIDQSIDSQSCRNPFELPASKQSSQHYPPAPPSQIQHQQQFGLYSNNFKSFQDLQSKHGHITNLPSVVKEHCRSKANNFCPSGISSVSPDMTNENEPENNGNAHHNKIFNSQLSISRGHYMSEPSQNDGTLTNSLGGETPQPDYSNQLELSNNKPDSGGNGVWNKSETNGFGSRNMYLSPQNVPKNFNNSNANDYSNWRTSETLSKNSGKREISALEGLSERFEKQSGSFNSLSQKFPPVPQSNYDLNQQIYDSMTGGNRSTQSTGVRPLEKNTLQFTSSRNRIIANVDLSKSQPHYGLSEQDKRKNYIQTSSVKQYDVPGSQRVPMIPGQEYRLNSCAQFNTLAEETIHGGFQSKRQAPMNSAFSSPAQSIETKPHVVPTHDRHRDLAQSFSSEMNSTYCISQTASSKVVSEKCFRSTHSGQSQSAFLQKHQQSLANFESKKTMENKLRRNTSQYSPPQTVHSVGQPMVPSTQAKSRTSSFAGAHVRSKRESPLDLSVKTVRQSADSTAKDDSEVYVQSFRNYLHGANQSVHSENRYAVTQSNEGVTVAPKIDFTPNFSGFHTENESVYSPVHHKSTESSVLPPLESFKKRLPAPILPEGRANSSIPSGRYLSSSTMSNQKLKGLSPDTIPNKNLHSHMDNFVGEIQKRPSNDPVRTHSSQTKIPKIDPWKLAFDEQIEQRLNSARISQENNKQERVTNGVDTNKLMDVTSQNLKYQNSRHSNNNYRSANMYPQPPVQTSAAPYNPGYVRQPQCQPTAPQTPQERTQFHENIGHSPDPEQIIKQISKGVMPDHKLLQDKNVLSILRSSLEEKEAKLMQLKEAARRKERCKEFVNSDLCKKSFDTYEPTSKNLMHDKQSLPPFGALTLERMCAPPSFPGHRLNLSRSVDTVKIDIEPTQKYLSSSVKNNSEKSGIPNVDMSPHDEAQGPPTDFDGLAAFLAARIRTKGELKQVDPGISHHGSVTSLGEYLDRGHHSGHSSSSNFPPSGSPPKLVRESRLLPPVRRKLTSHTEDDTPTTSDAHCDDQLSLPPRDPNGIRSSSETSVFDFRESDSEGEMPVLERQTLEGMRRDRKTFGSKQNLSTTIFEEVMEVDKPEVIAELDKSHPDPFWNTAFDMFVEQLEKRPPKRSVRKKKVCSRTSFADSEADEGEDSNKEKIPLKTALEVSGKSNDVKVEECSKIMEKTEPEERDKVEEVQRHVKLSSSRLKIYRNELMRENKLIESKIEKVVEKTVKNVEKPSKDDEKEVHKQKTKEPPNQGRKVEKEEKGMKEESGIRTRGKSRTSAVKLAALGDESDTDGREVRSDTESDDDDDSLFLSGSDSDSSGSETNQDSSNSNFTSCDDSEVEIVTKKRMRIQTRLQTRSSKQRQVKSTGMKLRSKPVPQPKMTTKPVKKKKKKKKEEYYSCGKKKKPSFGDGSDFRPGWEEECYKFKQQLRMPEKLISISRPPKRSSVSLPDLEPYRNSPSFDSPELSTGKKSGSGKAQLESDESDIDGSKSKAKSKTQETSLMGSDSNLTSLLKLRNGKKSQPTSILNLLVDKYGKGNMKKQKELKTTNDKKSPKILPRGSNKPELLPTPSLGIGKENVLKDKKRSKDLGKKKIEESDSVYIGYFRRKTVNNFKEAFKQKVGLLPQDFNPVVLKSRTRTQTRDLKKKATLVEVFGDERPASAPPLSREEDAGTDQEKTEKSAEKRKPKIPKKVGGGVVTRGRGKLIRSGRPGLRSTAVLRSNRAVQISKRHLNSGRKRNMELLRMRAMACKKFSYLVNSSEPANQLPITKKRLKLRSVRRKFRSGFDYIRKKKKLKKDGDSADGSVKEKRLPARPTSESVEDIQNEIKNWVINKGLGETILHRAARLGYTDVAAYCLEKMDCSPSPRDNAGYTPLHEACSRGHLEIAKLLLMYGASVSESAKGGVRPLHEAAENGFTELIRLLLSYGADPLLETYTGHTALSLVTDEEAKRLILHHLADVQGNVAPVWSFQGPSSLFDPPESGYDPLCDPPSPQSVPSDCEFEVSETMLPPLYRFVGDREPERRWLLVKDLLSHIKVKSKDVLIKQLGAPSVREMKLSEFYEQGKCCNLFGMGEKLLTKPSKVALVPYDDKVRQLLGVEKVVV